VGGLFFLGGLAARWRRLRSAVPLEMQSGTRLRYRVAARPAIDNDAISDAELEYGPGNGDPELALTFDDHGARQLEEATRANVGRKLASVLDGVVAAPALLVGLEGQVHSAPVLFEGRAEM
jgi:preprotein translocase subunit SecD